MSFLSSRRPAARRGARSVRVAPAAGTAAYQQPRQMCLRCLPPFQFAATQAMLFLFSSSGFSHACRNGTA